MKGVYFAGDRTIEMIDFPDPEPGPREVIVQMKASGMCGSDLHGYRAPKSVRSQRPPNVGGHEPCGVVVARGSSVTEDEAPIGMRAMIYHYSGCEKCKMCMIGYYQMCLNGSVVYQPRSRSQMTGGLRHSSIVVQMENVGAKPWPGTRRSAPSRTPISSIAENR